jgi:Ger(x)C family germination protein
MKRINKTLIAILVLLTLLSGCWNNKDIDKRVLPLVMGITKADNNEYMVTLQIPPKKGRLLSSIVTRKDQSVSRALWQIQANSESAVDYKHVQLVIIQKLLANNPKELRELIMFLMTSKEIPPMTQVAFTNEPIEKLLTNLSDKLGNDATPLFEYFNKGAGRPLGVTNSRIWEVYKSLSSYTEDISIPVIGSGEDTALNYKGAEVLKKGKITQMINPDENQLISLFHNNNANGEIESVGFASVMIKSSKIESKSFMKNENPIVNTNLKLKIDILERKAGITDEQIKHKLKKLIEGRFHHIFKQAQKNNTDIFGFGQYFRSQIPYNDLENWREKYYPELKVNFQVQVIWSNSF